MVDNFPTFASYGTNYNGTTLRAKRPIVKPRGKIRLLLTVVEQRVGVSLDQELEHLDLVVLCLCAGETITAMRGVAREFSGPPTEKGTRG